MLNKFLLSCHHKQKTSQRMVRMTCLGGGAGSLILISKTVSCLWFSSSSKKLGPGHRSPVRSNCGRLLSTTSTLCKVCTQHGDYSAFGEPLIWHFFLGPLAPLAPYCACVTNGKKVPILEDNILPATRANPPSVTMELRDEEILTLDLETAWFSRVTLWRTECLRTAVEYVPIYRFIDSYSVTNKVHLHNASHTGTPERRWMSEIHSFLGTSSPMFYAQKCVHNLSAFSYDENSLHNVRIASKITRESFCI